MGRLTALALAALFVLTSCSDGRYGPWVRSDGSIIESSLEQRLLLAVDVAYDVLFGEEVLTGLQSQGFTHTARPIGSNLWVEREIFLDPAGHEDFIYVVVDGEAIERWVRYEGTCER